jgi:hypothetical protein
MLRMALLSSFIGVFSFCDSTPLMPRGRYQGAVLDVSSHRSGVLLADSESTLEIDYFFSGGSYWQAVIPKAGVSAVYAQKMNFSELVAKGDKELERSNPFLNHVQMRVRMKAGFPIRLFARGAPRSGVAHAELLDFVYSVEVVAPKAVQWNFADAVLGNFVNGHRFVSLDNVAEEKIRKYGYDVEQIEVGPLTEGQKQDLLVKMVAQAGAAGLNDSYFLIKPDGSARNCTSEFFRLLDSVVPSQENSWSRFLNRLPLDMERYLKVRGLFGGSLPSLNDELGL